MRITKLHLLGIFLLCGLAFSGHYYFNQKKKALEMQEERARVEEEQSKIDDTETTSVKTASISSSSSTAAAAGSALGTPVEYTTQKGDTLWKVAKMPEHFGSGHRWYDIWKANEDKILDFDHLEAGITITIPLDVPEHFSWPQTSEERKEKLMKRLNPQARRALVN